MMLISLGLSSGSRLGLCCDRALGLPCGRYATLHVRFTTIHAYATRCARHNPTGLRVSNERACYVRIDRWCGASKNEHFSRQDEGYATHTARRENIHPGEVWIS